MKNGDQEVFLYNNYILNSKGNMVFATATAYNSLIEYNIKEQKANMLSLFDKIEWDKFRFGYGKIYRYNSYIVILPRHNFEIIIYDEVKRTTEYLTIPYKAADRYTPNCFGGSLQIGKDIFLIGLRLPILVKLDCEKIYLEVIDYWVDEYERKIKYKFPGYFRKDCVYKDNHLYICCIQLSAILKVNLQDYSYYFIELDKVVSGISTMSFDGKYFWITDRKGTVIQWNEEKNIEDVIQRADTERDLYKYAGGIIIRDMIYLFPSFYDKLTVVDMKNKGVISKNMPVDLIISGKNSVASIVESNDEWIMVMNDEQEHVYKYFIEEDSWKKADIKIPEKFYRLEDLIKENETRIMQEQGVFNLNNLLEMLMQKTE